ncbi:MAG: hypothetical protein BWX53_00315 [Parcubacteria group bacterium ADurb.Bin016]|jgi:hypothetical protein|nr:MAG: hypothetical protein BWX53_00315 [Parcubacteria group bacterium ADurb.Bin016]HRT38337.1 hypothetical protein [Rectinema sp.]
MKLKTQNLIHSGTKGVISSYVLVADCLYKGQIRLNLTFSSSSGIRTISDTFESKRTGYNLFYKKLEIEPYEYVNIEIDFVKGIHYITDFYINTDVTLPL